MESVLEESLEYVQDEDEEVQDEDYDDNNAVNEEIDDNGQCRGRNI